MRRRKKALGLALALGVAACLGASDASAVKSPVLRNLMKRLEVAHATGNHRAEAQILKLVSTMGPDEYTDWASLAAKGQAAAAAGNSVGAKAACTRCHDQYRDQYKNKYGSGGSESGNGPEQR